MRDDGVCQDLDNNLLEGVVTFGKAVEEEVQVACSEILRMVSLRVN